MSENLLKGFIKILKKFKTDLEHKYIQRKCLYTVDMLLIVLNDLSPTIGYSSGLAINSIPGTKGGFCNFRQKFPWQEFEKFSQLTGELIQHSHLLPKTGIYCVDGSRISLPNIFKTEGYNLKTSDTFVHGSITAIIEATSKIPVQMALNNDGNERMNLMKLLEKFQKGAIFIMDSGYYSHDLLQRMIDLGVHGLFRITTALKAVKDLPPGDELDTIVNMEHKKKKFAMRVIKYVIKAKSYYLGTTLLDKDTYPRERLIDMYHSRWTIESFFKLLKSTGQLSDIHSRTENGMKQEFYLNIIHAQLALALQVSRNQCLPQPKKGFKTKTNDVVMLNYIIRRFGDLVKVSSLPNTGLVSQMASDIQSFIETNIMTFRLDRHFPRIVRIPKQQKYYPSQEQRKIYKTKNKRSKAANKQL